MSKRNTTILGPGDACDKIAALREATAARVREAVAKVLEGLQAKENAIRDRVPPDRLQSFDHMLKSIAPAPSLTDPVLDALDGDVDPADSKALLELRNAIDEHLPWPSEAAREKGEYEHCVIHSGNLLRKYEEGAKKK